MSAPVSAPRQQRTLRPGAACRNIHPRSRKSIPADCSISVIDFTEGGGGVFWIPEDYNAARDLDAVLELSERYGDGLIRRCRMCDEPEYLAHLKPSGVRA